MKPNDLVNKVMRAWGVVVESPTQELYASVLMGFKMFVNIFQSFLAMSRAPY